MSLDGRLADGALVVRFDRAALGPEARWLVEPLDGLVAAGRLEDVHVSRGARVLRSSDETEGPACYWKEFRARNAIDRLKELVRPSRAERALAGDRLLVALGLDVAPVLAVGESGRFTPGRRCFQVTRAVVGRDTLYALFDDPALAPERKRRLIETLGEQVARMHEAGVVHGDLRPGNVLADPDGRLLFLDNERTRRSGASREQLRNLVQLSVDVLAGFCVDDRRALLDAYLRGRPHMSDRRAWLEAAVVRWVEERHAKDGVDAYRSARVAAGGA